MVVFVLTDSFPACLLIGEDLREGTFRDEEAGGVVEGVFERFLERHLEGVAGADEGAGEEDLEGGAEAESLFVCDHDLAVFLRAFGAHCHGGMW